MADLSKPTVPATGSPTNLSEAFDQVKAAGLQDLNGAVDAPATIGATSTAKSVATAENVTGSSTSLSEVLYNSGLQASASTANLNTAAVKADAGLSGIATTTAASSASTSNGTASAFAAMAEAAGIQDLDRLTVGGELDKLASNISFGRDLAGVHWRTDGSEGMRLGEKVAVKLLRDRLKTYNEKPGAISFRGFDGGTITI